MDKRFRLCIVVMLVFMIFNGVLEAGVNFHIRKVLGDLAIQGVVVTSGEGDTIRWLLQDMLDTTQTIEGRAYLQKNTDTTQTTPAYYTIYEDTIINGEALLQDTTEGISEGDKGEIEITISGIINRAERTLGIRIYDLLGRERKKAILKPGQKTGAPQKTGTYILQTPGQTYRITTIQGKILTTKKQAKTQAQNHAKGYTYPPYRLIITTQQQSELGNTYHTAQIMPLEETDTIITAYIPSPEQWTLTGPRTTTRKWLIDYKSYGDETTPYTTTGLGDGEWHPDNLYGKIKINIYYPDTATYQQYWTTDSTRIDSAYQKGFGSNIDYIEAIQAIITNSTQIETLNVYDIPYNTIGVFYDPDAGTPCTETTVDWTHSTPTLLYIGRALAHICDGEPLTMWEILAETKTISGSTETAYDGIYCTGFTQDWFPDNSIDLANHRIMTKTETARKWLQTYYPETITPIYPYGWEPDTSNIDSLIHL